MRHLTEAPAGKQNTVEASKQMTPAHFHPRAVLGGDAPVRKQQPFGKI